MSNVVFIDTETTGLDPNYHDLWEIALISEDDDGWVEDIYQLQLGFDQLSRADATALRINRYYDRIDEGNLSPSNTVADEIAHTTAGKHLVGAVPSFDAQFLDVFLRRYGKAPAWHYHLIDVEALAVGYLAGKAKDAPVSKLIEPPWNSSDLTEALNIVVDEADKHTALGDARWAMAIYDKIMGTAGVAST